MKGFILLASLGLILSLHAAFSGSDFVHQCAPEARGRDGYCDGLMFAYLTLLDEKNICYRLSEGITIGELRKEVVDYLQSSPMAPDTKASLLIAQLLQARFPCSREWPIRTASTSNRHNQSLDTLPWEAIRP